MNAELPCVAERADLFGLARRVLHLSIFHVALPRRHLPVRSELDAVRRIEIDRLDLALQPFLLREARHHQQRVAEDHPVRPVLIVVVEIHLLVERRIVEAVEIVEQRQLGLLLSGLRRLAQVLDERLRMHLLLDVDRNDGHLERARILLVLPFPHELRIERRIARIAHRLRRLLVFRDEVAQLLGRNVDARIFLVANRRDLGRRFR